MSKLVPEATELHEQDEVNLSKLTREILAMLAPLLLKKIELEFETDEKMPKIYGNPTALGILIRNLVDNSIRYSMENGRVIVRLLKHNNEIILEVCDNGPGYHLNYKNVFLKDFLEY
ncbi:ATP-binding protein [Legionella pneumophila]|nr:ATP-binding protein [Legionella pneumophila]